MATNIETPTVVAPMARLRSLDALRGFAMFWIIGGEDIVHNAAALCPLPNSGKPGANVAQSMLRNAATLWHCQWLPWLSGQLQHPDWNGFKFYDLIFPTFLFIAGTTMPFSFGKRLATGDTKADLYRHAIVRGLVLVVLGMIYNGLLNFNWPHTRLPSVLGRIGLAYMFAAFIVLNTEWRGRLAWIAGLWLAYWAALKFVPVPGFGAGDLLPGHTLTDFLDRTLIPGHLYRDVRDPEGLLGTVPAIGTALAGSLAGELLKSDRRSGHAKTAIMVVVGLACLGVARLWDFNFPINKNLWSSSFAMYCAGWSSLFLALFYLVIDVWGCRAWAFPLVVIGSNSILIYMARAFVDFEYTTHRIFDGALRHTGKYEDVLFAAAVVLVEWVLLYVLYRRRIFLKV